MAGRKKKKTENPKKVSAYCRDALGKDDGVALARKIRSRKVSPEEVITAAIARAEAANPRLNAIVLDTFEQALEKSGSVSGPFRGVPSFIKDNDNLEGLPTRYGSRAVPDKPVRKTSRFSRDYQELGFVILGKSTLPEFGLTATTESTAYGATHNPWNINYSTGGSSGGSAALVASGVVPIAHANDGGGSIRIPASCCGLVGLKPSRYRLPPIQGTERLPIQIATHGIVSRSVRDTAVYYAEAEKLYRPQHLPEIGLVQRAGKERLKIGLYTKGFDFVPADDEIRNLVHRIGTVCQDLGHEVEETRCPFDMQTGTDFLVYWGLIAFFIHHFGSMEFGPSFNSRKLEPLTYGLSSHFVKNVWKVPLVLKRLNLFAQQYERVFKRFDILLSPTMSLEPTKLGYLGPDIPYDIVIERLKQQVPFTNIQNISGAPAISLPLGISQQGLPLGIQFAAAYGKERRLLEVAFEMEKAMPWPLLKI